RDRGVRGGGGAGRCGSAAPDREQAAVQAARPGGAREAARALAGSAGAPARGAPGARNLHEVSTNTRRPGRRRSRMLASIAAAWGSTIASVIPVCVLLERWWPRHRAPIEWRRIALAAALFAVNLVVVRAISCTPPSSAIARIAAAWVLAELS